jgi:hypothetical protein
VLGQEAEALDLRNLRVRPECRGLFERVTGLAYAEQSGTGRFDAAGLPEGYDAKKAACAFGQELRKCGYRLLYLPGEEM